MYYQVVKCQRAGLCLSEHFLINFVASERLHGLAIDLYIDLFNWLSLHYKIVCQVNCQAQCVCAWQWMAAVTSIRLSACLCVSVCVSVCRCWMLYQQQQQPQFSQCRRWTQHEISVPRSLSLWLQQCHVSVGRLGRRFALQGFSSLRRLPVTFQWTVNLITFIMYAGVLDTGNAHGPAEWEGLSFTSHLTLSNESWVI